MRHIPWDKVITAIRLRDAVGLRHLADEGYDQQRELLDVFADIVESGTPIQPQCTCRTALHRADGYSIEVRLDQQRGSRHVEISGQIANGRPECRLRRMAVLLVSDKDLVAQAVSDELGAFRIQCVAARRLRLCVPLDPPSKTLELPLGGLIPRFLGHCGKTEDPGPAARAS